MLTEWQRQKEDLAALRHTVSRLREELELAKASQGSPEIAPIRAAAIRELARLLPVAVQRARAKNGSPALLRLILRSIRTL